MLFLSLPRFEKSLGSSSADEEDRFCNLLRRTGAKWWLSKENMSEAEVGTIMTEEEEKLLVFGLSTNNVGVWVLIFESIRQLPRDFGRIHFAMKMEENIEIMKENNATFVEDITQVEKLRDR